MTFWENVVVSAIGFSSGAALIYLLGRSDGKRAEKARVASSSLPTG